MPKRVNLIPIQGNYKPSVQKEFYIKSQIRLLMKERYKFRCMKDNAATKKEINYARLCLRTIDDSLADYRKKIR